jgi:hypothetical protein
MAIFIHIDLEIYRKIPFLFLSKHFTCLIYFMNKMKQTFCVVKSHLIEHKVLLKLTRVKVRIQPKSTFKLSSVWENFMLEKKGWGNVSLHVCICKQPLRGPETEDSHRALGALKKV